MTGFEPIVMRWDGKDYTIPAADVFPLIQRVEDVLVGDTGGQAITALLRPGGPPHTRLAAAYAAALQHGGAAVSRDEVYLTMMDGMAAGDVGVQVTMQAAILNLIEIVAPPVAARMSLGVSAESETDEKK